MGVANEEALPLENSNHRELCQFKDHEDQRFMPIKGAIKELAAIAVAC